jgi:propionyl-CoA carboxylase alpha chain
MRQRLNEAAAAAARAVAYAGAGTVEFLADEDGGFFFLEMNTRLQVEHPVTECITGLDLVALQVTIAEGTALPPDPPAGRGSAIEARLYAEDPAAGWAPRSGTVRRLEIPGVTARFAAGFAEHGLRLDSAVAAGTPVGVHYDPLLAKVIAWGPDRRSSARLLARSLRTASVHGVVTNRDVLVRVLEHPAFLAGDTPTSFLEKFPLVSAPLVDADEERRAALAAALVLDAADRAAAPVLSTVPSGWRNVVSAPQIRDLAGPTARHRVAYRISRRGLEAPHHPSVTLIDRSPDEVILIRDGVRERYRVARYGQSVHVDGPCGGVRFQVVPRFPEPAETAAPGSLVAPLPGTVTAVHVSVGDRVAAGSAVLTMEAMKMQHTMTAPSDGVVREVAGRPGQQVQVGTVLLVIAPETEERP